MTRVLTVAGILGLAFMLSACQAAPIATAAFPAVGLPSTVQYPQDAIPASTAMTAREKADAPVGYAAFCKREPGACPGTVADEAIALDQDRWRVLQQVNIAVNQAFRPMNDAAHYGVVDHWAIPRDGFGDCEDYALAKRSRLVALGFPAGALRLATARLPEGQAHALLTVATDRGIYVLNNLSNDLLGWRAVNVRWIALEQDAPSSWAVIVSSPTRTLRRF